VTRIVTALLWLPLAAGLALAQQATLAEVEESLETSFGLARETVEALNAFQQGGSLQAVVEHLGKVQSAFRPLIVLIAQTEAPEGARRFAMNVAMGAKSVELATWYYLYGLLGRDQAYLEQGDALFRRGLVELELARQLPR
jgi:hypothetical protein